MFLIVVDLNLQNGTHYARSNARPYAVRRSKIKRYELRTWEGVSPP